jgi:hypothetical protein
MTRLHSPASVWPLADFPNSRYLLLSAVPGLLGARAASPRRPWGLGQWRRENSTVTAPVRLMPLREIAWRQSP